MRGTFRRWWAACRAKFHEASAEILTEERLTIDVEKSAEHGAHYAILSEQIDDHREEALRLWKLAEQPVNSL